MKWDVIVVGAGPGGSSAAYDLARAGLRVLVLEKENLPRYKPCGGGLTAKVQGALDFDFSETIEDTVHHLSAAYGADRTRVDSVLAWCVMRAKFDALLANRAVAAGAQVRDGQPVTSVRFDNGHVTITTRTESLHAAMVVGADGVNGIVRRSAGLGAHPRIAVALEAEMDAPSWAIEQWRGMLHVDFSAIAWGYAWIFPKAEHLSVGIGELVPRRDKTDLRAALERYVATEPSLRAAQPRLTRGHRIPLGGRFGRYHASRAVLVGDAAGLADPFTGEGIYYAIRSGQIAAEEIARALNEGRPDLASYTRRINSEVNSDFRYAWLFTQLFYRLPQVAYRIFVRSAAMQSVAGALINGGLTYRRVFWELVTRYARQRGL